jgi:hypothetical protein
MNKLSKLLLLIKTRNFPVLRQTIAKFYGATNSTNAYFLLKRGNKLIVRCDGAI